MPKYHLNALGDVEFERMVQSLIKRVIGAGTLTFGAGRDGGREATFRGEAPYPSEIDHWSGEWVFQVKFHDTDLIGVTRARQLIIHEAAKELHNLTKKYKLHVDNYILVTNVPLSGVHAKGTLDRLEKDVFERYQSEIPHLAVWGADDVNGYLDLYPELRRPYLPLLITGDIVAELLIQADKARSDLATTVDLYVRTAISREENAQLDQAGDVSEDAIPLQAVFFDLNGYITSATQEAVDRYRGHPNTIRTLPFGETNRVAMVEYLISSAAPDRVVIIGGPGEGKSTIGQYLAQLHRAALLGNAEDIAISAEYVPATPRIPFRVVLKDFAQWLADRPSDSSESASLDSYLSEQVSKFSTRDFTERDLHDVLKSDPAVLVLDGLDEVTDAIVRRRLVSRLIEFIDRCQNGLNCDLQVVAATRPTNYSDQFDPKTFLNFYLDKLSDRQVNDYASKWAFARMLDESKAGRLQKTIKECLADSQISLLMTTPLQVTILILIINSGGTPPRQREALFNEYLEVIYKREKAKGLDIVKTEKELLIGLHKFVGYLLHEEATKARTSSATLTRPIYDKIVTDYLRNYDPYSPPEHIHEEWKQITIDAGERLVLLVESPADVFGFELRSIQEFFAACYLSDTAGDTSQRYERLAAIAPLPHWRNVTLFFAGRVGRSYPGEAANVVEVCKDMDRRGPDYFAKRGAEVALELAAERALGPNRVLQRSLLEYGLTLFDSPSSSRSRSTQVGFVRRLPYEDIRDHVIPIMEQRLPSLGHVAVANACFLLVYVAPDSTVLRSSLLRFATEAGREDAESILGIIVAPGISSEFRGEIVRILLQVGVEPELIGSRLGIADWPTLCAVTDELAKSQLDPALTDSFAAAVAANASYVGRPGHGSHAFPKESSRLSVLLMCARAIGTLVALRPASRGMISAQANAARKRACSGLPTDVKTGQFPIGGDTDWLLWLAHLLLGDVTVESWSRFIEWISEHPLDPDQQFSWNVASRFTSPITGLITMELSAAELARLSGEAVRFGGMKGFDRWATAFRAFTNELANLSKTQLQRLSSYGPGALDASARDGAEAALNSMFDVRLQPIVVEWLPEVRGDSLSVDELDRFAEWFAGLPTDSPWRRRIAANRGALRAAYLGRLRRPTTLSFIERLNEYQLQNLASAVAAQDRDVDEDLKYLLSQPQMKVNEELETYLPIPTAARRRKAVLRLLRLIDDESRQVSQAACSLALNICLTVEHDDAPRSAIRSRELDRAQERLLNSSDKLERALGIALYAVRPPRSNPEWAKLRSLLMDATTEDSARYWSWAIASSTDVPNVPERWISTITSVLQEGIDEGLAVALTDILRKLLPRQSQSLGYVEARLGLPPMNY